MRIAFLVAALAVVLVLGLLVSHREPVAAQGGGKVQQWEYKVVYFESLNSNPSEKLAGTGTKEFNKLGADGWEFSGMHVGIQQRDMGLHPSNLAVFKRPKK